MKVKLSVTLDKDIWDKLQYLKMINNCGFSKMMDILLRRLKDDDNNFIFNQNGIIKFKE